MSLVGVDNDFLLTSDSEVMSMSVSFATFFVSSFATTFSNTSEVLSVFVKVNNRSLAVILSPDVEDNVLDDVIGEVDTVL